MTGTANEKSEKIRYFCSAYRITPIEKKGGFIMSIINLTAENFEQEAVNSDKKVLIDFWAAWCGPCKMIAPALEEIAAERSDIKVCKVNVDEQSELAKKFQVMSIPMLVVMKNGKVVQKTIGAQPKASIEKFVDEA